MEDKSGNPPKPEGIPLQIEIQGAEQVPITFANHVFVRHEADIFLITFSQVHGPYILTDTPEEERNEAKKSETVPARVVCRLAMSPQQMKEAVGVLQRNYNRYLKASRRNKEDTDA